MSLQAGASLPSGTPRPVGRTFQHGAREYFEPKPFLGLHRHLASSRLVAGRRRLLSSIGDERVRQGSSSAARLEN